MIPEIKILTPKKLVGLSAEMSFADNTTGALWGRFMPRRREIANTLGSDLYSMQLYSYGFFENFDPQKKFTKWAAMEVSAVENMPENMQSTVIPEGMYAVFYYKGLNTDPSVFQYIFGTWLPSSPYALDQRPHFELLGEKYKNNDPDSEEEIWIPVRKK